MWELYTASDVFLCLRYSEEAIIRTAHEYQNRWPHLITKPHEPKAEMARILGIRQDQLKWISDAFKRTI